MLTDNERKRILACSRAVQSAIDMRVSELYDALNSGEVTRDEAKPMMAGVNALCDQLIAARDHLASSEV